MGAGVQLRHRLEAFQLDVAFAFGDRPGVTATSCPIGIHATEILLQSFTGWTIPRTSPPNNTRVGSPMPKARM